MQYDGNLILYDGVGGNFYWKTNTYGNPAAYLLAQSNGNMVVWATSTTWVYAATNAAVPCQ